MTTVENVVKPLEDVYLILQSRTAIKTGAFYTWNFNTPVEINENAYAKIVARAFESYSIEANGAMPYMIRLVPTSSSIKHPRNATPATAVNEGALLEIAYDHRPADQAIEVKLPSQQAINEITLQITKTFEGAAAVSGGMPEFIIVLRVAEREPKYIKYGALSNITQRSRL
jgi:hypothetical protein